MVNLPTLLSRKKLCVSVPTGQEVKQITLSVKDESGEMFDFKGLPLEFILEIN